ncbi:hypothetical protein Fcan01_07522 [Folsomia candida]|uniref:Uncharacterized protein n=2 Tax=Folsomia candida TaxID=158441 RepID=A0A226EKN7_FOLCA|nr:hypothetical protein Fcan01_07522 [Folsomia candida]
MDKPTLTGFRPNDDGDETPLQGLYNDLLSCLGGQQTNLKPMTGFSKILNMITEVMNERQNTATTGDVTESETEPQPENLEQNVVESTDNDFYPNFIAFDSSAFNNVGANDQVETNASGSSESLQSIQSQCSTVSSERSHSESENLSRTDSNLENNNFKGDEDCPLAGGELHEFPIAISDDVAKALKQFGLEGLIPLPPKSRPVKPIVAKEMAKRDVEISGDNNEQMNPDDWLDKSPLSIGGSMLTNLLNGFTYRERAISGGLDNVGGMSDAES